VGNERILGDDIGWKRLECGVEVGYAILCEKPDEVESSDRVFALRGWKVREIAMRRNECDARE
jgi:hypothetical protein